MKSILFVTILAIAPSFASAESLICKDIQAIDYDANNNPIFVSMDLSVEVKSSTKGKYGFIAELTSAGKVETSDDVQLAVYAPSDIDIQDMVKLLRPDIDYSAVKSVRVGNVGVEANSQDSAGIFIMELLAADGSVLGKVAQVGWGAGNCQ